MNGHFLDISFDYNPGKTITAKTNDYLFFKEQIEEENTAILTNINNEISKKY